MLTVCSNSNFGLLPPVKPTLHMTEETSLAQVHLRISYKLIKPSLNGVSIADMASVFNEAQLGDGNTFSKSSTHHARSLPSTRS